MILSNHVARGRFAAANRKHSYHLSERIGMNRLSVPGVLSLLSFLLGLGLLGFAGSTLSSISADPSGGGDILAGFAVVLALIVGTIGIGIFGFGVVIAPARSDGGGVLTVRHRHRLASGVGLAILAASLLVPFVFLRMTGIVTALEAWLWLAGAGTVVVAAAFLWTVAEAALIRAGVVG